MFLIASTGSSDRIYENPTHCYQHKKKIQTKSRNSSLHYKDYSKIEMSKNWHNTYPMDKYGQFR